MSQTNDRPDVVIIGAGASGAAFAWSLAKDGFSVLCLEQGGWTDPSQYPSNQQDWEIHRQTDYNPDPNFRGLPEDYPVNDKDSPIAPLMYNAVGGSTIHWSAHFPRFHPSDFRTKTLDGVGDDWPVTYSELEPYFDTNDRIMGVAGMTGDTAYPPKSERQTPPIPLGTLGQTMANGFDKLGWHWWPSDSAILTAPYDGRAACNNCGPCDIGCSRRAKASTDVTYWPKALAMGSAAQDSLPGQGDNGQQGRVGRRGDLLRSRGPGAGAEGPRRRARVQWDRHSTSAVKFDFCRISGRAGEFDWISGQEPHVPSVLDGHWRIRRHARGIQGTNGREHSQPRAL